MRTPKSSAPKKKSFRRQMEELDMELKRETINDLKRPLWARVEFYGVLSTFFIGLLTFYVLICSEGFRMERAMNKWEQERMAQKKDSFDAALAESRDMAKRYKDSAAYLASMLDRVSPGTKWFADEKSDQNSFTSLSPKFIYETSCDQLCGKGHTSMRGIVVVETQEEIDAWMNSHQQLKAADSKVSSISSDNNLIADTNILNDSLTSSSSLIAYANIGGTECQRAHY
jgi:hypothetical protein